VRDGAGERLVDLADLLLELVDVLLRPRLEGDDAVAQRRCDGRQVELVAVAERHGRREESVEPAQAVDEEAVVESDVRDSDDADGEEDLRRRSTSQARAPESREGCEEEREDGAR